jgi:thiamine-phosphate pyrophosphorylase
MSAMTAIRQLAGFYAVLDRESEKLARSLVSPEGAGARVLQLRIKPDSPVAVRDLLRAGAMARDIAHEHGALFVVNDRVDLALALAADAVHLGQDDLPLADARRVLARAGSSMLIGVSTHDDDQVRDAVRGGADYLGYGPVFATATKRNPDPVRGLDALARAVELAGDVPVVAIGGVTPQRAAAVAAAGAAAACAIGAVNDAPDPAAAGRAIGRAFSGAAA